MIPSTEIPIYHSLIERIDFDLSSLMESHAVEFKRSEPWDVLRLKIVKTVIAMTNTRDGGRIIIGVDEAEPGVSALKGISEEHLATYDVDDVLAYINKYVSYPINPLILTHTFNGATFLVIVVNEFDVEPILCIKESGESKNDLKKGAIYTRPKGKPESSMISNRTAFMELLELANNKFMRRYIEQSRYIGFPSNFPGQNSDDGAVESWKSRLDDELGGL